MKLLILGGDGMLGHQLVASLAPRHHVHATFRQGADAYAGSAVDTPHATTFGVDVRDFDALGALVRDTRPDAVLNAVGIVKQRPQAKDAILSLQVNSLLPHMLASFCQEVGARLVHVSTDCVFTGDAGMYTEDDLPDARDLYGRSKLMGEVPDEGAITLRTSIIGLELARNKSLIEWFLAQTGPIRGFRKAIYSGFTTLEMARIIEDVLLHHPDKHGLWHVTSDPIDKFTLLTRFRDLLGRDTVIEPDDDFVCDRSMDSTRFRTAFGYTPPTWDQMLTELAAQTLERSS